jgi:hypothetical protein
VELPAPVGGRNETEICWDHIAPLLSRPVNPNTCDDGTAMFAPCKLAVSLPCAGSVVLPKKLAMEAV